MAKTCPSIVTKCECTETADIIMLKPVLGSVRMYEQGPGLKSSMVTYALPASASAPSGGCKVYGEGCTGTSEIGTSESSYSGTPYKIVTIRSVGSA